MGSIGVCGKCEHLLSRHRHVKDEPIDGPYRCLHCDCRFQRGDPEYTITMRRAETDHKVELAGAQADYDEWVRSRK